MGEISVLEELLDLMEKTLSRARLVSVFELDIELFAFTAILEKAVQKLRKIIEDKREEQERNTDTKVF